MSNRPRGAVGRSSPAFGGPRSGRRVPRFCPASSAVVAPSAVRSAPPRGVGATRGAFCRGRPI
eukprot:7957344-Lingulodinium_polyedra.AAC.1